MHGVVFAVGEDFAGDFGDEEIEAYINSFINIPSHTKF